MLQEHDDRLRVIRARTILDMLGERPATGRDLFRPLRGLDNAARCWCAAGVCWTCCPGRACACLPRPR